MTASDRIRLRTWSTRAPRETEFVAAWSARLSRTRHAHFALDLEYLAFEAARGRHALAVLADDGPHGGALVLRDHTGGFTGGWPWRWQAVVEGPDDATPEGLGGAARTWIAAVAGRAAGGRRVRLYLPGEPDSDGWSAGATYVNALAPDDDTLLRTMDGDKRRTIVKAQKRGWSVREARDAESFRAFAELQQAAERRRGREVAPLPEAPAAGESWREWELPWMGLLVAEKDGVVEAGSGFGWVAGGMLDYRANASSERGRREGANALLGFEAMRLGRDRGLAWINWGGATLFKRDFGGIRIPVTCALGGGAAWAIPNRVQTSLRRTRPRVARLLKRLKRRGSA